MSSYFKCSRCGHTVRILARGDTAICSQCGGTMYRCHHRSSPLHIALLARSRK